LSAEPLREATVSHPPDQGGLGVADFGPCAWPLFTMSISGEGYPPKNIYRTSKIFVKDYFNRYQKDLELLILTGITRFWPNRATIPPEAVSV
jgi:hypothetical protein